MTPAERHCTAGPGAGLAHLTRAGAARHRRTPRDARAEASTRLLVVEHIHAPIPLDGDRGNAVRLWRAAWPAGWRPDRRTVGLLLAGFFAYLATILLQHAPTYLDSLLDRAPAGIDDPTWARFLSGSNLGLGAGYAVIALAGLGLIAPRRPPVVERTRPARMQTTGF